MWLYNSSPVRLLEVWTGAIDGQNRERNQTINKLTVEKARTRSPKQRTFRLGGQREAQADTKKWANALFLPHKYFRGLFACLMSAFIFCRGVEKSPEFMSWDYEAEVRRLTRGVHVSWSHKTSTLSWLLEWPLSLCTVGYGTFPRITW